MKSQSNVSTRGSRRSVRWTRALLVVPLCFAASCSSDEPKHDAQQESQHAYKTPQAATDALIAALRNYDQAQLATVLGPDGDEVLSSGDDVADRTQRQSFLAAYDKKHSLAQDKGDVVLVVGPDDWPLPVPIVKADGGWRFDLERGKDEILSRRIGRNELATIEVCRAIADAQDEYASSDHGHGAGEFARKFRSSDGQHDGLYWPDADGADESPLGPLVAEATDEGYVPATASSKNADESRTKQPYHGYYFRILTAQGDAAPGGAKDYVVDGHMTGGFAVVAEPATYGNSGVMTFVVGQNGIVYQRDLGESTETTVTAMKAFDPTLDWTVVD